jgi:hypothetical protein
VDAKKTFHPALKKSFARIIPLEYTMVQAGAATAVKYPNEEAMAVTIPT